MSLRKIGTAVLALLPALVSAAGGSAVGRERIIDGIVAVVSGRIITLIDVHVVEAFGIAEGLPAPPGGGPPPPPALGQTVVEIPGLPPITGPVLIPPAPPPPPG